MKIKAIFLFVLCQTTLFSLVAQDLKIEVSTAFKPEVADASKISELPVLNDSVTANVKFDYKIESNPEIPGFELIPIKPASMVGEPISKLYNGYAKIAIGNYWLSFADLRLNTLRSKKYNAGAYLNHISSSGKIKNDLSKNVFGGNYQTSAGVFGKKFLKDKTLLADVNYTHHSAYFYGYNTGVVYPDSVDLPTKKVNTSSRQVQNVQAKIQLETNYTDSSHVNYFIQALNNYLFTDDDVTANVFSMDANFNYFFEKEFIGFDSRLEHTANTGTLDSLNHFVVKFNPWVGAFGKKWQVKVGLNTYFDQSDEDYHLYPNVSLHYNIIDYILIPYAEFSGTYKQHSYYTIFSENNFIIPGLYVRPTSYDKIITGGLRGNISSKIGFNISASYLQIKDMYYYVNDTNSLLDEKFNVVYDDVDMQHFKAEISYKRSEKLNFLLKAQYSEFSLKNEKKPWHTPKLEGSFTARYQLRDKFVFSAEMIAKSERYAKILTNAGFDEKKLDALIDLNLGLEYRYTKNMSAFIYLHNLGSAKYYVWNQYPTHRFNFMAGVSYLF